MTGKQIEVLHPGLPKIYSMSTRLATGIGGVVLGVAHVDLYPYVRLLLPVAQTGSSQWWAPADSQPSLKHCAIDREIRQRGERHMLTRAYHQTQIYIPVVQHIGRFAYDITGDDDALA